MSSIVRAQYMQVAPSVIQAAVQGYVPVEKKRKIVVLAVVAIFVTTVHSPRERHAWMKLTLWWEEKSDDAYYVKESDDDMEELRAEEMDKDEELQALRLMDFVFGIEDDS